MKTSEKHNKDRVYKAIETGKMLPETRHKYNYYKRLIDQKKSLIKALKKEQAGGSEDSIEFTRAAIEITELENSIFYMERILKEYTQRKHDYEKFLDEVSIEADEKLAGTLEKAKKIGRNIRLQAAIADWEKNTPTDTTQRVQFYLFLLQEIDNFEDSKKKKGGRK